MNQNLIQSAIAHVMPAVRATGLQVSLATFQAPQADFSAAGFPTGIYSDVAGLVGIHCQLGPEADMGVQANEQRLQPQITASATHRLELDDYYPALEAGWRDGWRVVVDGTAYDLEGVESDSQKRITRCKVCRVSI